MHLEVNINPFPKGLPCGFPLLEKTSLNQAYPNSKSTVPQQHDAPMLQSIRPLTKNCKNVKTDA
jgi:hypothetical protein